MEAAMRRCREVAAGHESPRGRVFEGYTDNVDDFDLGATYIELGFSPVTFGVNMVRGLGELPVRSLPPGVESRPVTDDQLRQIWEADGEAFKDHWGSGEQSESDFEAFVESPTRDNTLWRVAWDGDEVAGQVKSFIDEEENELMGRRRGYTEFISTGRRWRKQGVASALISESLLALRERGMTEAALGVHGENPTGALALYESLGFAVNNEWTAWQREF
jgi:ribosomal protein S18 acetylase RimI-like enzyme